DHYATLKVPRGAKPDEIKRSYRREALRWHPDKHTGAAAKSQAQQRFEKVNEAFSVLSDPQTRRRYN
ncbi:chaperone protein DnaJ, partial [Emiliania huxleyi CCMP1516]|uniref:J domain-containing protein n=2 Tax=Emiliania huxleyi TaxID=2903 RepID=A0A0D3IIB5_EMIH1